MRFSRNNQHFDIFEKWRKLYYFCFNFGIFIDFLRFSINVLHFNFEIFKKFSKFQFLFTTKVCRKVYFFSIFWIFRDTLGYAILQLLWINVQVTLGLSSSPIFGSVDWLIELQKSLCSTAYRSPDGITLPRLAIGRSFSIRFDKVEINCFGNQTNVPESASSP